MRGPENIWHFCFLSYLTIKTAVNKSIDKLILCIFAVKTFLKKVADVSRYLKSSSTSVWCHDFDRFLAVNFSDMKSQTTWCRSSLSTTWESDSPPHQCIAAIAQVGPCIAAYLCSVVIGKHPCESAELQRGVKTSQEPSLPAMLPCDQTFNTIRKSYLDEHTPHSATAALLLQGRWDDVRNKMHMFLSGDSREGRRYKRETSTVHRGRRGETWGVRTVYQGDGGTTRLTTLRIKDCNKHTKASGTSCVWL